tara:strand:+ start:650 stop:1018 length:369 start_codon:yes stop_codon:yes gene_type:complete
MKKYLNIKEVSKITGLKEHVIRYWDSINPKTNELRIQGISTKSKKGTRYFNKENLRKIENLKKLMYQDGDYNNSLRLADKLINNKTFTKLNLRNEEKSIKTSEQEKLRKIDQILKNMRILLK